MGMETLLLGSPVRKRVRAIQDALKDIDLTQTSAWEDLEVLSDKTGIDGVEVDPAGMTINSDNSFRGIFNIAVVLNYDDDGDEKGFVTSDALMAFYKGEFDLNDHPIIREVTVDTSHFDE